MSSCFPSPPHPMPPLCSGCEPFNPATIHTEVNCTDTFPGWSCMILLNQKLKPDYTISGKRQDDMQQEEQNCMLLPWFPPIDASQDSIWQTCSFQPWAFKQEITRNKQMNCNSCGRNTCQLAPSSQLVLTAHFDLDWCSIYSHKSTTVIAECLYSCYFLFLLISSDPIHRDLFEDCNWSPPRKGRQMPAGLAGSSPLAAPEAEAPRQGPWSKSSDARLHKWSKTNLAWHHNLGDLRQSR